MSIIHSFEEFDKNAKTFKLLLSGTPNLKLKSCKNFREPKRVMQALQTPQCQPTHTGTFG